IAEPYSFSEEASVSQGDGSVLDSSVTPSPPNAVAYDSRGGSIYAALGGGALWILDTDLDLIRPESLQPADPFSTAEVRGMAFDTSVAGNPPLYILLGDGRIYRRDGP